MPSILFVCTGNICRSPTAEAVLGSRIKRDGLNGVACDSAGTHGYHVGEPPDSRTINVAKERGILMDDLRARKVSVKDFERFDYLIAMDRSHERALKKLAPYGTVQKVSLFLSYIPDCSILDVPDPYYGGMDGFHQVLDMIEQGVDEILRSLDV